MYVGNPPTSITLGWQVRDPATTARGESFRVAQRYITLARWARRLHAGRKAAAAGQEAKPAPFVFDSNASSAILPALRAVSPAPGC